jgi:hypothetical protein
VTRTATNKINHKRLDHDDRKHIGRPCRHSMPQCKLGCLISMELSLSPELPHSKSKSYIENLQKLLLQCMTFINIHAKYKK